MPGSVHRLCVATPVVGNLSETFVRRHAQDLLPGETALVSVRRAGFGERSWDFDGPFLELLPARNMADLAFRFVQKLAKPTPKGTKPEIYSRPPGDARRLVRFLKDQGVEAIFVEFLDFLLPYIDDVTRAGIRWYSNGHGYDISQLLAQPIWVERYRALREASGVFVRAGVIKDRLVGLGLDPAKVFVVPCGIDVPDCAPPARERAEVKLLAVGRMVPKKAPLVLLAAFEQAAKRNPALTLEYVGGGPLFEDAAAFVASRGLEGRVVLHGPKPPSFVADRMADADIFVQHSVRDPETGDEEGLPVAITEAMACAIPVVSTRHAGIPEAVERGLNGVLVAEGDADGMAVAITQLAGTAEADGTRRIRACLCEVLLADRAGFSPADDEAYAVGQIR